MLKGVVYGDAQKETQKGTEVYYRHEFHLLHWFFLWTRCWNGYFVEMHGRKYGESQIFLYWWNVKRDNPLDK